MKLFNVRLSDDDARMVKALRRSGVAVSELVRNAIRAAYNGRARRARTPDEARKLIQMIYQDIPRPAGARSHGVDTTDRNAAAAYIRSQLMRKRRA